MRQKLCCERDYGSKDYFLKKWAPRNAGSGRILRKKLAEMSDDLEEVIKEASDASRP